MEMSLPFYHLELEQEKLRKKSYETWDLEEFLLKFEKVLAETLSTTLS